VRRAGCNTWRTLEWILPHPPPFHTFEEQPIIKETLGPSTLFPRPPCYDPAHDDPMEHSYHPGAPPDKPSTLRMVHASA
jgi:heme/copper-type cytochrome/quinol oxidase subunit 1